jgi:hypothetical protein
MAARLKVFVTTDGLTDYVVAASSRAKALAAWGLRQDAFKEGRAHETQEPALTKAALASPGEVLRRPADGGGALAKLKTAKARAPAKPSAAQRRKVADLEAELAALDAAQDRAKAALEAERAALERKAQAQGGRQAAARERLETRLATARKALDGRFA